MLLARPLHMLRMIALAGLCCALAGCLQPLYAPTAIGGPSNVALKDIEVTAIDGRFGHFLRTDLQFALGGGTLPKNPLYRLDVVATPQTRVAVVDRYLSTAENASLLVNATYTLVRLADGVSVINGNVSGSASFDRSNQRYATLRASQEAEERAATLIADQIRTRIAAGLAEGKG
jgi:LPS-assembly lipoprotein